MKIWWLVGAALLGVAAISVYSAFQSPTFVAGILGVMLIAAAKAVEPYVAKRMTPEQEKAFHDCIRRGGEWDSFRKRCRSK